MINTLFTPLLIISMSSMTLFNFETNCDIKQWKVIDDRVMGGRSEGSMSLNEDGHGVFQGDVSTENNGGFSSVRYTQTFKITNSERHVSIRLKGDGKAYQLRLKHDKNNWESYVFNFKTSGDWQWIEIPLEEMYPSFRGRKLNKKNFNFDTIGEIGFLISNKRNEKFKLVIDKLELTP